MVPTSALFRAVKTCVAVRSTWVDPQPSAMLAAVTPCFLASASMSGPVAPEYRPGAAPAGPNAALIASRTFGPGPNGFSLLDRMIGLAAAGVCAPSAGSRADQMLSSRPLAAIQEPVIAPAAPIPTV